MAVASIDKDPQAVLDYSLDWSLWLDTDTISGASWSVEGVDASLTVDSNSNTSTVATVWLSGGTAGRTYNATCNITTAGGREDDRSLEIVVKSR